MHREHSRNPDPTDLVTLGKLCFAKGLALGRPRVMTQTERWRNLSRHLPGHPDYRGGEVPTGWALYSTQTRALCRHQHSMHGGKTGARTKTDAEGWAKKEEAPLSRRRGPRGAEREGERGGRERAARLSEMSNDEGDSAAAAAGREGRVRRPPPVGRHGGVQWGSAAIVAIEGLSRPKVGTREGLIPGVAENSIADHPYQPPPPSGGPHLGHALLTTYYHSAATRDACALMLRSITQRRTRSIGSSPPPLPTVPLLSGTKWYSLPCHPHSVLCLTADSGAIGGVP